MHLRREAWHQLTTWLAATYDDVVIEDLDVAAMKQSMGRRAFRRAVCDTALGMFAPMLGYKAGRSGTSIVRASRWFPSSQVHHGCGCRLHAPTRMARQLVCTVTGKQVDRDINAALNLRDWPDHASLAPVRDDATSVPGPIKPVGTGHVSDGGTSPRRRSDDKTSTRQGGASRGEARTKTPQGDAA